MRLGWVFSGRGTERVVLVPISVFLSPVFSAEKKKSHFLSVSKCGEGMGDSRNPISRVLVFPPPSGFLRTPFFPIKSDDGDARRSISDPPSSNEHTHSQGGGGVQKVGEGGKKVQTMAGMGGLLCQSLIAG